MEGWEPLQLHNALLKDDRIYTTALTETVPGVRVSPQVYTRLEEMDRLVETVHRLAKQSPRN